MPTRAAYPHDTIAEIRSLRNEVHELAEQLRMARGTGDHAAAAADAMRATSTVVPVVQQPIAEVEIDGYTGAALYAKVRELITGHPMTFRELMAATGLPVAGENRIKGALVRLQRERIGVVNLGTARRAIWFAPSADVLARLRGDR